MTTLIFQVFLWLLAAFLLGLIIGWFLPPIFCKKTVTKSIIVDDYSFDDHSDSQGSTDANIGASFNNDTSYSQPNHDAVTEADTVNTPTINDPVNLSVPDGSTQSTTSSTAASIAGLAAAAGAAYASTGNDETKAADEATKAAQVAEAKRILAESEAKKTAMQKRDELEAKSARLLAEAEKLVEEKRLVEETEATRVTEEKRLAEETETTRTNEEKRLAEEAEVARANEKRVETEHLVNESRLAAETEAQQQLDEEIEADRLQLIEQQRQRDEVETARIAEEQRLADEIETDRLQLIEQQRRADEAEATRIADEERLAAEKAEADRLAEEKRLAEEAEAARIADEKHLATEKAEAEQLAEEKRVADEAEAARIAEEKRLATEKAEADRLAEEKRLAEEAEQLADEKRLADEAKAARIAEEKRLATEKAEADRLAEEKRLAEEAEAARIADEKHLATEKAEADRLAEEKRLADEAKAKSAKINTTVTTTAAGVASLAAVAASTHSNSSNDKLDIVTDGMRPARLTTPRGGKADNLKEIRGIGPVIEKTLNAEGIYHFQQIADFTPENTRWVDNNISIPGRVDRDDWIGQAKSLAAGEAYQGYAYDPDSVVITDEMRPQKLKAPSNDSIDDLKRIKGVGPVIETTLNEEGIYHFQQVADFTPQNAMWVDKHISFPGRIHREDWIGQAKCLIDGREYKGHASMMAAEGGDSDVSTITEDMRPTRHSLKTGQKPDDLKVINGIGPVIEEALNTEGVYFYQQVADFTEENTLWVDNHMAFPGRIHREDWIGQAKKLVAKDTSGVSDSMKPKLLDKPLSGGSEDLKRIKGIGKVLEKRLHKLGIYHYDQIAELTEDNIHWLTDFVSFPEGRIESEDWVGQAKALSEGKRTEYSERFDNGETPYK